MLWKMFAIYDAGAEVYLPPFTVRHHAEARRMLTATLEDRKSMIAKYPEQFYLYEVASYDDGTGRIICFNEPVIVCKAVELIVPGFDEAR